MKSEAPELPQPSPSPWLAELTDADNVATVDNLPRGGDIVIIGAGMTGCSLAYHLHLLGRSCVVLDARDVSAGGSGRNGGISWPSTDEGFEMRTAEALKQFITSHEVSCGFAERGGITLIEATEQESDGSGLHDGDCIDPVETLGAAPGIFKHGILDRCVASFWPAKVVRALARAAESAVFVRGCHVRWFEQYPETCPTHVRLHTSKGEIDCSCVVVATNGWIPRLLPELCQHFRACTNTVLCTAEPIPEDLRWPVASICSGDGASEVYLNMREDGRLLLGGLRDASGIPWGVDDDSGPGEDVVISALQRWFARGFPRKSALVNFNQSWVGVLGFPVDDLPLVGEMPQHNGMVFVIGGFCGHGMPRCFGLAGALAQQLCGQVVDEAEMLARCNVARFFPSSNRRLETLQARGPSRL